MKEYENEQFYDDVEWYCDNCDAHLNNQSGFHVESGMWTCKKCGWINDVSDSNILDGSELEFVRNVYVVCPNCGAHMLTEDGENFRCTDCYCHGSYDYDNEELDIEDDDEEFDCYERLSVYDAAEIWASHGKDEDYMFGYTEYELENAL